MQKKKPRRKGKKDNMFNLLVAVLCISSMFLLLAAACFFLMPSSAMCVDMCGDGICQENVCLSQGCPCAEDYQSCPRDCPVSREAARQLALDYVENSIQYRNYNGSNAIETEIKYAGNNIYEFSYAFEVNTELLPVQVRGFEITMRIAGDEVDFISLKELVISFCGSSTFGECASDSDCMSGGCSGQVCQSRNQEPVFTTCEYRECYDAALYGLRCICLDNKCQWSS